MRKYLGDFSLRSLVVLIKSAIKNQNIDADRVFFNDGTNFQEKLNSGELNGPKGVKGTDGVSPIISSSKSGKVTTITIVDANGTKTATINDGNDGAPGQKGNDGSPGVSPTVSVEKSGKVTTITIKDINGTKTATIDDGVNGEKGEQGSPGTAATVSVGTVTTGAAGSAATVKNSGSTTAARFDFSIPQGAKGEKGDTGPQGDTGPNAVSTTTTSNITGLLKGASGKVAAAVAGTDYISPSGGTMTGILTAQSNTSYTTRQVRNIVLSTADPSGGSNGDIWIRYRT